MTRGAAGSRREQQAAFAHLGSLDDPLSAVVQSHGPVDPFERNLPVVVRDPLEWLAFAVVGQQISMAAARAIYNRLIAALGGAITVEPVLAADDAMLLGVGLSHAKVRAIRALAEHINDGRLKVEEFAALSPEEIQAELVAVPGIGPWSAQMFMMHFQRLPDVFPSGDLGIRAAVTALDALPARITPKAAELRSQVWRPFRTYATTYLWRYIFALNHGSVE